MNSKDTESKVMKFSLRKLVFNINFNTEPSTVFTSLLMVITDLLKVIADLFVDGYHRLPQASGSSQNLKNGSVNNRLKRWDVNWGAGGEMIVAGLGVQLIWFVYSWKSAIVVFDTSHPRYLSKRVVLCIGNLVNLILLYLPEPMVRQLSSLIVRSRWSFWVPTKTKPWLITGATICDYRICLHRVRTM